MRQFFQGGMRDEEKSETAESHRIGGSSLPEYRNYDLKRKRSHEYQNVQKEADHHSDEADEEGEDEEGEAESAVYLCGKEL